MRIPSMQHLFMVIQCLSKTLVIQWEGHLLIYADFATQPVLIQVIISCLNVLPSNAITEFISMTCRVETLVTTSGPLLYQTKVVMQ